MNERHVTMMVAHTADTYRAVTGRPPTSLVRAQENRNREHQDTDV